MMKRMLAMLLAVLMVLSLAGCGADTSDEDKSVFCEVCGVYYPEELGAPVLGEAVGELVSQDISVAAEQITNVGDAIYYLQAANAANRVDAFVALIKDDYDEVGTILFMTSENYKYTCAYVRLGENYYPFDPVKLGISKILDSEKACGAATDIEALAQRMQADFPRQSGVDVYYSVLPMYRREKQEDLGNTKNPSLNSDESFISDNEFTADSVKEEAKYSAVIDFYDIPIGLGEPQYSEEEIKALVAANITLDEAADKLTTLADVIQYLYVRGYGPQSGDVKFASHGYEWSVNRSARVVFDENSGNCGGGSHLLNYLLSGDYDEQGYVHEQGNQGGHVYNYFKHKDMYYFCDLTQIVGEGGSYQHGDYRIYVTKDPQEFSDYYISQNRKYREKTDPTYLVLQYMYPCEGSHKPIAQNTNLILQGPLSNILSREIELTTTVLFLEEPQYAPIFVDAPSKDLWPAEAQ